LFGDDHVGVDIDHVEGRGHPFERLERFHGAGTIANFPEK
jgi:hypothetical protein